MSDPNQPTTPPGWYPDGQGGQHGLVKVQRRRGGGHSTGVAGEHGLVAFAVVRGIGVVAALLLACDVGRQRQVAVALHQLPGGFALGPVQGQAKQWPLGIGPAAQQGGIKTAVASPPGHEQGGPRQGFFAHLHVCHHFMGAAFGGGGQHTLNQ